MNLKFPRNILTCTSKIFSNCHLYAFYHQGASWPVAIRRNVFIATSSSWFTSFIMIFESFRALKLNLFRILGPLHFANFSPLSIQPQLKLSLVLFPVDPSTHTPSTRENTYWPRGLILSKRKLLVLSGRPNICIQTLVLLVLGFIESHLKPIRQDFIVLHQIALHTQFCCFFLFDLGDMI